jgi:hypothetical protein
MNVWTVRIKHTPMNGYSSPAAWEGSGWTTVYQTNQSVTSTGWVTFTFTTPFAYNGTDNLMIDFSHNNVSYTTSGLCRYSSTSQSRSIYYYTDSGYGDPLAWSGTGNPTPTAIARIPNIRLTTSSGVTIHPTVSGNFVAGVWSGNITVQQVASSVLLRADDGSGHTGNSNPFDVVCTAPTAYGVTGGGQYCAGGGGVAVGLSGSQTGANYYLKRGGADTGTPVAGTGSAISFGNQINTGTYTVVATNATTSCRADMTGNAIVTVDTTLPTLTCPADLTTTNDMGQCFATAVNLGVPVATNDNCALLTVTNDAPAQYPRGVTTVTWTAVDSSGNLATGVQTVTVNDTEAPTLTCPADVTTTNDVGQCFATGVNLGVPLATNDNCALLTVTNDAPAQYPKGVTTVTWTAADSSGNLATGVQTVTVNDTELPSLT